MEEIKTILKQVFGTPHGQDAALSGLPRMGRVDSLVQKTRGDRVIWALIVLLTLASLLLVYSSTGSLAYRTVSYTHLDVYKRQDNTG